MLRLGPAKPRFQVSCTKKANDFFFENSMIHWKTMILPYVMRVKARVWGDQKGVMQDMSLGKWMPRPCVLASTYSPAHGHYAMAQQSVPAAHIPHPPALPPLTFHFINSTRAQSALSTHPISTHHNCPQILGKQWRDSLCYWVWKIQYSQVTGSQR